MPDAGEVCWIPKHVAFADDSKDRRHVLAHGCVASEDEIATLFYCSSQPTQASFGARHVVIAARPDPLLDGPPANGFTAETYVYPGAPVSASGTYLTDSPGQLDSAEFCIQDESWIGELASDARQALVLVREAFYVHPSALRSTRYQQVVSATTMRRIEDALLARWTL